MSKTQVVFCTDGIYPEAIGGMQRHSRLLIEALATTGKVDLIVVHPHDKQLFSDLENVAEELVEGIDEEKTYLIESKLYSKRVLDVVKKYPNAVVYSQGLSIWYGRKEIKDRLIVNPHGLEPFQALGYKDRFVGYPFRRVFRQIFRSSRFVVSLGGKLTTIIKGMVKEDSIAVIPNAVAPERKAKERFPEKGDPIQVFFLARFAHNKGIHVLYKAVQKLEKKKLSDKFKFVLGGKGPLFEEYKSVEFDNVDLLGFVEDEDLASLYLDADIFLLPTLFEGMPTVVLEAMAHGLPIIVSNVGATSEEVDESNGYLLKPEDANAIVDALVDYLNKTSEEKKKMGEASRKRVQQRFTWKKVADQHITLFNKVAEEING